MMILKGKQKMVRNYLIKETIDHKRLNKKMWII